MIKVLCVIVFLFIFPQTVYASAPQLVDPQNNSSTSDKSPKLSWQEALNCPSTGNCYRVEVSNSQDFSELEKSTYTNNTSYSPTLSDGIWFWRIKAKDQSNNWSEYSEVRTITISNHLIPSSSPIPTINPSVTPTTTPIPQGGNNEKEKQSFSVSVNKTTIDSKETIELQVSLNNFSPSITYYLKPSFYQEGSTNYFGLSEINNTWTKNSVTATSQYKITTDSSGNWQGKLNTKVDPEDSGFKNTGNYQIKVGRYTETGSGPNWSNSVQILINHTELKENTNNTSSPTPNSDNQQESVLAEQTELDEKIIDENEEESTPSSEIDHQIATISAVKKEINPPTKATVKGSYQMNWWFICSGLLVMIMATLYVVHQRKRMYHA